LVVAGKSVQAASSIEPTLHVTCRALCVPATGAATLEGDVCVRTKAYSPVYGDSHQQAAAAAEAMDNPSGDDCDSSDDHGGSADVSVEYQHHTEVELIATAPSNSCQTLHVIDLRHRNGDLVKQQYRRSMKRARLPLVGTLVNCHPLKNVNQGICKQMYKVEFEHPVTHRPLKFQLPFLPLFQTLLARERKYFERKHDKSSSSSSSGGGGGGGTKKRRRTAPEMYELGISEFMGRSFFLSTSVLIPRESSSGLVTTAVNHCRTLMFPNETTKKKESSSSSSSFLSSSLSTLSDCANDHPRPPHVLDLGVGSGCLLLSLMLELDSLMDENENNIQKNQKEIKKSSVVGVGVDFYSAALQVAVKNSHRFHLSGGKMNRAHFFEGTFQHPSDGVRRLGPYDVVLCNPPYRTIRSARTKLDHDVLLHEPREAILVQGEDTLIHYREVCMTCRDLLRRESPGAVGGRLIFESPPDLIQDVREMMKQYGYTDLQVGRDVRGSARVVSGVLKETNGTK
jgi:methylase of polypeptide subunit release factors